ncbi:hypothetical protein IMF27_24010 [Pseudomonas sp. PCH199]|uniref:hypothetical protein n=1 Tax=unclassified Pseudomonas TaxID=196821 RepID=UPI000BD89B1A|nr:MULTISPECIES: hypothetical protein [unclassified Pseudomonas]MCW8278258.1 hypothetical protein [Pseudomonas sp. PCH199]PAM81562.1 hypothetical protein CES87_24505 [Pseudomonas sp. ERMR1:02]
MPAFGHRGLTGRLDQKPKRGGLTADLVEVDTHTPVGAGLLAKTEVQSTMQCLIHRLRQQAGSYRFACCTKFCVSVELAFAVDLAFDLLAPRMYTLPISSGLSIISFDLSNHKAEFFIPPSPVQNGAVNHVLDGNFMNLNFAFACMIVVSFSIALVHT